MKKIFSYFLLLSISITFSSASSDNPADSSNNLNPHVSPLLHGLNNDLYGTWVDAGLKDSLYIMHKAAAFEEDNGGFAIYPNGVFVTRGNAGWCGTPPISYQNYNGSWNFESGSLLNVNAGYWGGTNNYKIKIVSLTETELICSYIYSE